MLSDGERRQRLSVLCKRLRGNESLRSFTKNRSKELQGISHGSWGAWESRRAGLSADSLDRLANFIGCSHPSLYAYLDGSITLEELLQPTHGVSQLNKITSKEYLEFSPDTIAAWIKSLQPQEQMFLVFQGFEAFKERFDYFVEQKANEQIKEKFEEFVKNKASDLEEEVARQIVGERAKLLIDLLSRESYPQSNDIAKVAQKLNLRTEDLMELCDRVYLNKSKKEQRII